MQSSCSLGYASSFYQLVFTSPIVSAVAYLKEIIGHAAIGSDVAPKFCAFEN